MKIEKKTIALCMISLVIGIAIILPIAYDRGVTTTIRTKPLFNIDILYANVTGNTVSAIINVTATPEVAKLRDRDVKMEIYNFHFYTDQASIANFTYTVDIPALTTEDFPDGQHHIAISSHLPGTVAIADEAGTLIDYSTIISHTTGIGGYTFQRGEKTHVDGIGTYLRSSIPYTIKGYNFDGEEITVEFRCPVLYDIENAQMLYVEVTRIMSVSYQRPLSTMSTTSSNTTTILPRNEVVTHIELTKIESGFVYGNYEQIVKTTGHDIIINYNSETLHVTITGEGFTQIVETKPADNSED